MTFDLSPVFAVPDGQTVDDEKQVRQRQSNTSDALGDTR